MSGLVFGKYEKIRRLAEGGMGEVWLARQVASVKGFDRLVILKALKRDMAEEVGFVEQFLDEARVAATLNHPGIVALYEVGGWDGTYYIAMEYIAGDDLSRLWYAAAKRGVGLPFQVSVKIVHDAALALDHAHHAVDVHGRPLHIVHRDVSPQNVMVRADGVTKLVDFGIAKATNRVSVTKTGTVKGKLQYMSPEQVRGEPVDARSDQFSLGIVLWEMCAGKRLFKGDTELATLNKILQLPIPTPSSIVPGFPSELERVIARMLERDKERRYPRCADVARDLRAYLDRAAHAGGEIAVADFVEEILGDELRARTRDLTPDLTQEVSPLDASLLQAPTTQSAEADEHRLITMPITAVDADAPVDDEAVRARRRTLEQAARPAEQLTGDAFAPEPPTTPTLPVPVLDDDDASPRRRGGGRFVLAGMGVVLLLAAGGFFLLDDVTRARLLLAVAALEPGPPFDDAALYATLRADEPSDVENALAEMSVRYEGAKGEERARAAAYASMLASALVRQASAHGGEPSSSAPTRQELEALRVRAYKLASEARALARDLPEAHLAMASYQAARGAGVEAEADLASLDGALAASARSDDERGRLRDEARAQREWLAALSAPPKAKDPESDAQPDAQAAVQAADEVGASTGTTGEAHDDGDLMAAGRRAQEAGKSFEAATHFRKVVQADKRRVDAWIGLGWAYVDLGKGEAAVRSFRRALSLPNAPSEAQFGLAEAYRFSGRKAQAVKAYERYLKQSPAGPDAEVAKNALTSLRE